MELKRNILDIKGLKVGQAENPDAKTGVTVVLAEGGAVCGVDVRGAAPAQGRQTCWTPSMPWKRYRPWCFPAVLPSVWRLPAASWTGWRKKASALM